MRVAYFTESLYPHVDGVSRTLAQLFATLEQRGIDFTIFSPFTPGPDVSWHRRVLPMRYLRFPLYPDYRVTLPLVGKVRRVFDAARPDLIHLVSPTPMAFRAQGVARRFGIPFVTSFHTHFVSYFRHYGVSAFEPVGWSLLRRFYRDCASVYAPSQSIADELRERGIERVEIWSRGIDMGGFSPRYRDPALRERAGASDRIPMLLMVSRLVKEKDLAELVSVERLLRGRGVPFSLVLVGDGPMGEELRQALPEAFFAGHQVGESLARWYASADVFVLPSTTETLGNVVLEALASGVAAVVVDRGGPQDLIRHGVNGFVARANNPDSIADHLQILLEDADLRRRMGEAARESAASRDWDRINGGLLASYEQVRIGSRGAAGGERG